MSSRWNLFVDYIRGEHGIGRMEHISLDVVLMYGAHVAHLVEDELLMPATAQCYLSTVNRVMSFALGNRSVWVSPVRDCGIPRRSGIASVSLAVPDDLHREWIAAVNTRLAAMLELQRELGLRFEESAKIDARAAFKAAESGWVTISDGTKGGRVRRVPVETDRQMEALGRAAAIQGADRSMIPAEMSYKEFRRACYRTSVQQGIRFHRERHTYAHRRYRVLAGADCPVASKVKHGKAHWQWLADQLGMSADAAKAIDLKTRKQIALELGHNRLEVCNAYLG